MGDVSAVHPGHPGTPVGDQVPSPDPVAAIADAAGLRHSVDPPGAVMGALPAPAPAVPAGPPEARHRNRHLSWLDFNDRVLALAADPERPLLERCKFLAIASSNLDEFFQVRVGGLREQQLAGLDKPSADGLTVAQQLRAIRARATELVTRQARLFTNEIVPALEAVGIRFSDLVALDEDDRRYLDRVFEERIFPVLTPLAVDPAHPFPFISNLSLNLAVVVSEPAEPTPRIARVKVPPVLDRFVVMPDGERFVPLEQVIAAHLDRLFPGMQVVAHHPFRVTRNADFDVDDEESEDLVAAVETVLRRRRRSPLVVRLEIDATMSDEVQGLLMRELEIDPADVVVVDGPLDLRGLWALHGLDRPELKEPVWTPVTQPRLSTAREAPVDLFRVLDAGPVLVHHPYDSYDTSVEAFVEQAAVDPDVLAIKQTLYRTSGPDSPMLGALVRAAEEGKQVVALVELTARFDEEANLAWARTLERAGVHVVYGMVGLKTHAKVTLVMRRDPAGGIRRYCHVGTGNYNEQTARLYEDIGLLSADPELGADLTDLFNYLTGYSRQRRYRRLLVAPLTLRSGLLGLVARESHPGGRITLKVNNLVDPEVVEALYAASSAGADVDLVVRSACGVRPGIPGMSERIRVRSLVGRYLEHSRIYRFGSGDDADYLVGSADLMARNLDGRVEVVIPVTDRPLRARLEEILEGCLHDDVLAWELDAEGGWHRVAMRDGLDHQRRLQETATARSAAVP